MADKKSTEIVAAPQSGVIHTVVTRAKLIFRLMGDSRVSPFVKLLPLGALVYLVSPLDFLPGGFDDAALLGMGYYFFIEMCPRDVVEEHLKAIEGIEEKKETKASNDVVDGEATDIK